MECYLCLRVNVLPMSPGCTPLGRPYGYDLHLAIMGNWKSFPAQGFERATFPCEASLYSLAGKGFLAAQQRAVREPPLHNDVSYVDQAKQMPSPRHGLSRIPMHGILGCSSHARLRIWVNLQGG